VTDSGVQDEIDEVDGGGSVEIVYGELELGEYELGEDGWVNVLLEGLEELDGVGTELILDVLEETDELW
jgi:hypothetical protein